MRAVDRTTKMFVKSVRVAMPGVDLQTVKSVRPWGRSTYVYISSKDYQRKVRISDHPVGMRRALSGECDLFITAGADPASWTIWLAELVNRTDGAGIDLDAGPLFTA